MQINRISLRPRVDRRRHGTVTLSVSGPKHLFPGRRLVTANLTDKWIQVFNKELEFPLDPAAGYYVRRIQQNPVTSPKDGKEWECGIDEKVSVFMNKFQRRRNIHAVVLCRRDNWLPTTTLAPSPTPQPPSVTAEVDVEMVSIDNIKVEEGQGQSGPELLSDLRIDSVVSVGVVEMFKEPSTSRDAVRRDNVGNEGSGEMEEEEDGDDDQLQQLEWGRDDDDMESLATGVGREMDGLNRKGIPVQKFREKVEEEFRNCTDNLILGVMDDVKKQKGKPSWENMVQKMPSVCLLLEKFVNSSN